MKEFFHNLDPKMIYSRFFHPKKTLTEGELKTITEADFFSCGRLGRYHWARG